MKNRIMIRAWGYMLLVWTCTIWNKEQQPLLSKGKNVLSYNTIWNTQSYTPVAGKQLNPCSYFQWTDNVGSAVSIVSKKSQSLCSHVVLEGQLISTQTHWNGLSTVCVCTRVFWRKWIRQNKTEWQETKKKSLSASSVVGNKTVLIP